jgi:hypothetical protein
MTYLMNAGDIVQVTVQMRMYQQIMLNTYHYRLTADVADGAASIDELLAVFDQSHVQEYCNFLSTAVTFGDIVGQKIWPIRYLPQLHTPVFGDQGLVDSEPVTTSVAAVIRRKSILASKSARGRVYIPGIPFTNTQESQLPLATMTAIELLADVFADVFPITGPSSFEPVIYNRSDPQASAPVILAQVDPILRNQRRRQIGVGV